MKNTLVMFKDGSPSMLFDSRFRVIAQDSLMKTGEPRLRKSLACEDSNSHKNMGLCDVGQEG